MSAGNQSDPLELAELYARRPQVIKPGLARIEAALKYLDPERLLSTPTVLVGGTNGKGTTSGFLWQLASALGWRVGLFTSPHLQRFAERIQVSGRSVTNELLVSELKALQADLPRDVYEPLSFFEINTLLALRVFAQANTDINILEVGMGGRWDSTNISRPIVSIITSVGLDHQQWLGTTTTAIAREKAGIMRPGRPVLWGGERAGDSDAVMTLRDAATALGAMMWEQGREFYPSEDGVLVNVPSRQPVLVPWPHQAQRWPVFLKDNFAKASAAFRLLLEDPMLRASRCLPPNADFQSVLVDAVRGMEDGKVPTPPCLRGRFEHCIVADDRGQDRNVLFDVCHNIDGAKALVRGLKEAGLINSRTPTLPGLVSILTDKDCDEILDVLRQVLDPLILFATSGERSWSADRLATRHRDLTFLPEFAAAWSVPVTGPTTVICGSVHAVGEVTSYLGVPIS